MSPVPLVGIEANIFSLTDDDNGNVNNKLIFLLSHSDLNIPPADLEYIIFIRATKLSDMTFI